MSPTPQPTPHGDHRRLAEPVLAEPVDVERLARGNRHGARQAGGEDKKAASSQVREASAR